MVWTINKKVVKLNLVLLHVLLNFHKSRLWTCPPSRPRSATAHPTTFFFCPAPRWPRPHSLPCLHPAFLQPNISGSQARKQILLDFYGGGSGSLDGRPAIKVMTNWHLISLYKAFTNSELWPSLWRVNCVLPADCRLWILLLSTMNCRVVKTCHHLQRNGEKFTFKKGNCEDSIFPLD